MMHTNTQGYTVYFYRLSNSLGMEEKVSLVHYALCVCGICYLSVYQYLKGIP